MGVADLDLKLVTAHYVSLKDGSPLRGTVEFIPSHVVIHADSQEIALPPKIPVQLDPEGKLSIGLPATDDPALTPQGWVYRVVERFSDVAASRPSFNLTLPTAGGSVDLSEVAIPGPLPALDEVDFTLLATFTAHRDATTGVHGVADTAALETQAGAQAKADAARDHAVQRVNHSGTQAIATVSGLQAALDGKAAQSSLQTHVDDEEAHSGGGGGNGGAPTPHLLGGEHHSADTLANLNAKITGATLDDAGDPRTPNSHGNEAHDPDFATAAAQAAHAGDTANPHEVTAAQVGALTEAAGNAAYVRVVQHGADNTAARPAGVTVALWEGSVAPDNGQEGDLWADTANDLLLRHDGTEFVTLGGGAAAEFIGVKVWRTAAQSINNNTWTGVQWDAQGFDTDGFHDTVTNNTRFTIPAGMGGRYLAVPRLWWDSDNTGTRFISLRINGATIGAAGHPMLHRYAVTSTIFGSTAPYLLDLDAGDYFEVFAFQNTGSSLNLRGANADNTHSGSDFSLHKIG